MNLTLVQSTTEAVREGQYFPFGGRNEEKSHTFYSMGLHKILHSRQKTRTGFYYKVFRFNFLHLIFLNTASENKQTNNF